MVPLFKSIFLILICSCSLQAQIHLSGQIISSKDSSPIAGASIYFDGTSIGVSSQEDGRFSLKTDKDISSDLIINALGYNTRVFKNPFEKQNLGLILLAESQEPLGVVRIEADPWSRQKKLEIFRKEFLGNTPMAIQCQIQNEEALILRYIPSTKTLVASADQPLKIINKYLGYMITYNLTDFKAEFSWAGEILFTERVYYEGTSFFEELRSEPLRRYLRHRKKVFEGSYLHFMRSLAKNKVAENGFKISNGRREGPLYTFFKITPVGNMMEGKILKDKVNIDYGRQMPSILSANGIFYIDENGNVTPPENVLIRGKMGIPRVAGMLPLDYKY